LTTGLTTGCIV